MPTNNTPSLIYQVYVRSFADSNGDGIGDLQGVVSKLDHLAWLGVDTVWLSPTYPSPNVDWGYDVADYYDVHPELGTLADLDELIAAARERGIAVLLDLVPNHTSDRHAWFTERPEYYVWSKTVPNDWKSVFTGESAWQWHEGRQQYYLHQFAPAQPDLDWWNEDVREEFDRILRFWFERGIAGFRIDVAHGVIKDKRLRNGVRFMRNRPEVHEVFARWQRIAGEYDPKPILLGETYVGLDDMFAYWQHLDLVMNFDFLRAPFTKRSLQPIIDKTLAHVPADRRPLWFGSNHDHSRFATRWAKGSERKVREALELILTLPGVAILYQGDEIGLPDGHVPKGRIRDVADPSRDPERTPMPWTRSGDEWRNPWLPLEDTSRNVEYQREDAASVLNYARELIRMRNADR